MEIAGDVVEHWAIGTLGDADTTMLTTYVSDRFDGKSPQEAFQNVMSSADDILVDSMWTSAAGTLVDSVTAPKCFVAGTMVVTAGGLVAIENIQPGDVVLAANEETGEVAYKEVVHTFVNTTDEITHVTIENAEGKQETIDSTPEHPFYVEGLGWVEASSLHAGMTIWFANGTKGTVEDISNEGLEEPVTVYNFEVADFHTYFVGENGIFVHNYCGTSGDDPVVDVTTGQGYDAGDAPVRIEGEWTENDMKQALLGHPPRGLGSPDIHHGGQMPGAALHEVLPDEHRNNPALHQNKYNQGVTPEMRQSDRELHWWYRAREQGADQLLPDWIYDD